MAEVDGAWNIEIATPMGTQRFALDLVEASGSVSGTATNNTGPIPIEDGKRDGDQLAFSVKVTSPFPLTVVFTLDVDGDRLSGQAKTGPFPASPVTGQRG